MVEYTPRFIEDFVIEHLTTEQNLSNEDIANKFMSVHGVSFNNYLEDLVDFIKVRYRDEIAHLDTDETKNDLKEKFIAALKNFGILDDSERGRNAERRLQEVSILFFYEGSGGGAADKAVAIDFLQNYKFQSDFADGESLYPFITLGYGVVFHELGHRLRSYLNAGVIDIEYPSEGELRGLNFADKLKNRYRPVANYEERFAQGISRLVMQYLQMPDVFTDYYQAKEKEIQSLGTENRERASKIFGLISAEAFNTGLPLLRTRTVRINSFYAPYCPTYSLPVENYANPLSLEEIHERIRKPQTFYDSK